MRKTSKKILWITLVVLFSSRQGFCDETKFLKVGSWAVYKMSAKTGGAAGKMVDSMASSDSDLPPGMTPEMMKMIPPDQLAKIKAQMKQKAPQMQAQKNMMQSMKDPMKNMDAVMKMSIVGEEMRGGKPFVWAEMSFKMDAGKMMEAIPADMKDDKGRNVRALSMQKLAEAGFPGGKINTVVKMLLPKAADMNSLSFDSFKPVEMIMKMGNKPIQKKSADELAALNGEAGKSYAVKQTQDISSRESNTSQSVQEKNIDIGAKASAMRAGLEPVKEFMGVVKGIPGVGDMPQTQIAVAGLRGLDSMLAAFEDVNVKVKKVTETKSDVNVSGETETESETNVKSQKTEILGVEKVETKNAGTIPALHARMIRETEMINRSKSNMEAEAKFETTTTKTRKVEGEGGGAKLLKAIGMEKTKISKGPSVDVKTKIEDLKTENKMAMTNITEYYMSPSIPGLGLVKMVQKQQTEMGDSNISMGKMKVGNMEMDTSQNSQMQMMMQQQQSMSKSMMKSNPYGDMTKQESATEFYLDSMGDSGAKSEL